MYSAEPPYPLGGFIYRDNVKPHLEKSIPGARVEITKRHKQGIIEATCTIKDHTYNITITRVSGGYTYRIETPRVWAENDFDYESEDEMHNRNQGKISNAVKKLLTK